MKRKACFYFRDQGVGSAAIPAARYLVYLLGMHGALAALETVAVDLAEDERLSENDRQDWEKVAGALYRLFNRCRGMGLKYPELEPAEVPRITLHERQWGGAYPHPITVHEASTTPIDDEPTD
jgi:hypothetical protein